MNREVRIKKLARRLSITSDAELDAMLGLVETALGVSDIYRAHCGDGWATRSPNEHLSHLQAHAARAYATDNDGTSELSHAVCRAAFLLALRKDLRV